jgi:hypothetical protein
MYIEHFFQNVSFCEHLYYLQFVCVIYLGVIDPLIGRFGSSIELLFFNQQIHFISNNTFKHDIYFVYKILYTLLSEYQLFY